MNRKTNILMMLALAVALLIGLMVGISDPIQPVQGAPAAAITPVAIEDPLGSAEVALVKFYDAEALTADDQNCIDLGEYRVIDLEYVVDQGTTNTTTVILQHTNGAAGTALTTNTDGQTVVSANAADADGLNRYDLFGRWTCVDVNVTNSNAITWTVWGLARK